MVDIDISAFFDEVDHDRLMAKIGRKVRDKAVLKLIGRYLRAPMQRHGRKEKRSRGTPQGGPLSPLLANIYLDDLDKELERRGLRFCRYADDLVLFVGSERSGDRILESLTAWIAKHLKLRVNVNKSGVGRPWNGKFLGFRITKNGKIGPAKASLDRLKAEVRRHWNAQLSVKLEDRVIGWQRYIRGGVELLLSLRIPASGHHPGKLDASAHAQILLAALAQPARSAARPAEVEGKTVPLETSQRFSRDLAFGAQPYAANRLEQRALAALGPMGAIRFCDILSCQVQPPDAENRMSGGVGGVTGAIPLPPPDPPASLQSSVPYDAKRLPISPCRGGLG